MAEGAIADDDGDVGIAEFEKAGARAFGEVLVAFDGNDLGGEFSQDGRLVG